MFKQGIPRFHLSIEEGTENVPADRKYYVLLAGEVQYESVSKSEAMTAYNSIRDELLERHGLEQEPPSPEDVLRRQRAESDLYQTRVDAFRRREKTARSKGGKGGRGGV